MLFLSGWIQEVDFDNRIDHHEHVEDLPESFSVYGLVFAEELFPDDLPGQIPVQLLDDLLPVHVQRHLGGDKDQYPQQAEQSQQCDGQFRIERFEHHEGSIAWPLSENL